MERSSLAKLLQSFSFHGRKLLHKYAPFAAADLAQTTGSRVDLMLGLARDLLSSRGEASGVAIATDLLSLFEASGSDDRAAFFDVLATELNPRLDHLKVAWERFRTQGWSALPSLAHAVEPPRQELFRRLNLAPGGTAGLVRMREELLTRRGEAGSELVDADLAHVLKSWFNRGFLSMQPITWSSPASLLERVIRHEAVHDIRDWTELRGRLDPPDRRCFAFFHPAMPEEPLIFVEVALTKGVPNNIQTILASDRIPLAPEQADTAVFYSISNCQSGLRGISFGHFLIKQVAIELKQDLHALEYFVTLSPIPGFMDWFRGEDPALAEQVAGDRSGGRDTLREVLLERAATYLTETKNQDGKPRDPVARFHLGNGARLERLNWMGDSSEKALRQSAGLMVNYLYHLPAIEELHEAFANQGTIITGKPFEQMICALKAGRTQVKRESRLSRDR